MTETTPPDYRALLQDAVLKIRELKASGGYLSFDEPVAHFGLGDAESVEKLVVKWSTGGSTEIAGPFAAGHLYTLQRR